MKFFVFLSKRFHLFVEDLKLEYSRRQLLKFERSVLNGTASYDDCLIYLKWLEKYNLLDDYNLTDNSEL